jgi:hypothetical protein
LFQESVAHQELLGGTTDVSIAMLDSHTGESSLLNLKGNASSKVEGNLGLLGWMNTWVHGSCEDIETLVSDFVDHFIFVIGKLINKN